MDSAKLNDWLQVIGMFGVLAGLVFVGLELRQSHKIALAAQYHARAESTQAIYLAHLESGFDYATVSIPMTELSPTELNARRATVQWLWTQLDNLHFQYQAGFLTEESRVAMEHIIKISEDFDLRRAVFDRRKATLRSSFVALVEKIWQETSE